jgi:hypothetical protein
MTRLPVRPARAASPWGRGPCRCLRACCRGWLGGLAYRPSLARGRIDERSPPSWSSGRQAPDQRPQVGRGWSHGPSTTAVLRPARLWSGPGAPRCTGKPRAASRSSTGLQDTPGDARATGTRPHASSPSARALSAAVTGRHARPGGGARSSGPAMHCAVAPPSMPAACRWTCGHDVGRPGASPARPTRRCGRCWPGALAPAGAGRRGPAGAGAWGRREARRALMPSQHAAPRVGTGQQPGSGRGGWRRCVSPTGSTPTPVRQDVLHPCGGGAGGLGRATPDLAPHPRDHAHRRA